MSRPSRRSSERLARIEGASGCLALADTAVRLASLRVRALQRRIGPGLHELVAGLADELVAVDAHVQRSRELLHAQLAADQMQRRSRNGDV
jgi:hypothetical protein